MKTKTKAILSGMCILVFILIILVTSGQLNKDTEQQQKMEAGILQNPARELFDDSVQLQKREANRLANFIREWKEWEEGLQKSMDGVSTRWMENNK